MTASIRLPFITLWLLISFASVNAVLFTPALPDMASFFGVSDVAAQQTITWFLVGYAAGQLIYGPLANRLGRKRALYIGIHLQIFSSLLCVLAGIIKYYELLIFARFLLALGSGVGLKMTFTLVNECYEPKIASQKISYLILAFAMTPGLATVLGGVLNTYYGWMSCFYTEALYGFIMFLLVMRLPETKSILDLDALKIKQLAYSYGSQFKNSQLVAGGLLMAGSIAGAKLAKKYALETLIVAGITIASAGGIVMLIAALMHCSIWFSLFIPMMVIYFGSCFILANASTLAMQQVSDKAAGSAVMNFINMGLATFMVLSLGLFTMQSILLPGIYLVLCGAMIGIFIYLGRLTK